MSSAAPVAVIVVSYETRALLARCLDSLEPEVRAGQAAVWVVDNGSTDGSPELVRDRYPWVTLIAREDNLGFGRAVNLAAREATGASWIAPANADIVLEPGALAALLAAADEDPQAGAVAPQLIHPDGSTQHSLHPFPTVPFTLLFNLGLQRLSRRWGDRMCLEGYWDAQRPRRAPWAVGAFLLVRRAAWDAAGGFDERRWMYAEDLDLGWRLARSGRPTRYVPGARVHHDESAAAAAAWGEARTARWMRATYAWMQEQRGVSITRTVAALNVAGAGARWLWRVPAARAAPDRFAADRDAYAAWARLHAVGLSSAALVEQR